MTRDEIFAAVDKERAYQDEKWGPSFDDKNTANDWVAYLAIYVGKAVTMPWNRVAFHASVLKVMTLCCAILERDDYPPRHYDSGGV